MLESNLAGGRFSLVREWIIFALCLGLGGHIVLGIVIHDPDSYPWSQAGIRGLVVGLSVYALVQIVRSLWWFLRGRHRRSETDPSEDFS